jgi:hypothetical protein
MKSSGKRLARKTVEEFPAGREVPVHYNPARPEIAVLKTDLAGGDAFGTIFMTPFNLIMITGWIMTARAWRAGKKGQPPAGGKTIIPDPRGGRVCLARVTPLAAAAITAGLSAFVLVFVIAFTFGMESMQGVALGWGVIVALTGLVYVKVRSRIASGLYDLVIDRSGGTVSIPALFGRKQPRTIPIADVASVDVAQVTGTGDDSGTTKYHPTLHWREPAEERDTEGTTQSAILAEFFARDRAESLATWLRTELKLGDRVVSV